MPAASQRPVTIKDIAKRLKISHQAVSQALHFNDNATTKVSPATRRRIIATAEKMGYRPSRVARALRTGRSNMLGVIFPVGINQLSSRRVYEAIHAISKTPYAPLIQHAPSSDPELMTQACEVMIDSRVEGIMLFCELPKPVARRITANGIPMVAIGHRAPTNVPKFFADRKGGMLAVTRHMIEQGRRSFSLLTRKKGISTAFAWYAGQTIAGYKGAFEDSLLPHTVVDISLSDLEEEARKVNIHPLFVTGYLAAKKLVSAGKVPEAVICQTDNDALGVMRAFGEAGIRVPADAAVSGFENDPTSSAGAVPLTSVDQQWDILCSLALARLQLLIGGAAEPDPLENVSPCKLVVRQSTTNPVGNQPPQS